jgi:hypothetical protein
MNFSFDLGPWQAGFTVALTVKRASNTGLEKLNQESIS